MASRASGGRVRLMTPWWVAMAVGALLLAACSGATASESPDTAAEATESDDPTGPSSSVDADAEPDDARDGTDEDGDPVDEGDATGSETTDDENADSDDATDDEDAPTDEDSDREEGDEEGDEEPGTERPIADEPTEPDDVLTAVGPDDDGDDVIALQTRLDELGFSPGPADGDYGRRTEAAVRVFQELVDLMPTGEAGIATMRELATYEYDGLILAAGDEGEQVEVLQRRLADGPFDPGAIDGVYGQGTISAVWALEKLAEVPVDGDWGPADELAWQRLMDGEIGAPQRDNDLRWVEVDLSKQLMKVYDPGSSVPVLISHASSGSGIPWENEEHSGSSVTPKGDFHISRRINGWRESSLNIGRLYNPLYFNGGIAFHGATSVPLYPASHGCIRLPMHIAEYLPAELPNGTPVHVMA